MKKLIVSLMVVCAAVSAFAATTKTVTNSAGQVFTVTTDDTGTYTSSGTMPTSAGDVVRDFIAQPGVQISTNATVSPTLRTPRDIGDLLVGIGATKAAYVATGVTSNDWTMVSPLIQYNATVTLNAATVTPRFAGDILVGTASGKVFTATSTSTNSWVTIK